MDFVRAAGGLGSELSKFRGRDLFLSITHLAQVFCPLVRAGLRSGTVLACFLQIGNLSVVAGQRKSVFQDGAGKTEEEE